MKKKILISICFVAILFLNAAGQIDMNNLEAKNPDTTIKKTEVNLTSDNNENQQPALELYSKSAVLLDADTNRVLYDKNADMQLPMASTTKIMTCICALENSNPEDEVTISEKSASQPKVRLGVTPGDKFKLKDLLYSLMLESHNDAAVAIAEHVSGSVENFAELMNQKARDLGCYNTYFIMPNGLDSSVILENNVTQIHHTTAVELAKIMNYCVYDSPKSDEFLDITRTPSYTISELTKGSNYNLTNHNAALTAIEGAVSGKTGFTNEAGYCYVGAFTRNDKKFTVALLACGWPNNKNYKWKDTKTLLDYGDSAYNLGQSKISDADIKDKTVNVYNCSCFSDEIKTVKVYTDYNESDESNTDLFLLSEADREKISYILPCNITKTVQKDEILGHVYYMINDYTISVYPIKAVDAVSKNKFSDYIYNIFQILLL